MKKLISIFLTIVMVLSVLVALPAVSEASDGVLIDYGSKWKYTAYEEDPSAGLVAEAPEGWLEGADSAEWKTTGFPVGDAVYGGGAPYRLPYQYYSAFFRKTFNVGDLSKITTLTMYIKYDENPTVYLNGTVVWSATGFVDSRYVEVDLSAYVSLLSEGENTMQIAISNVNGGGVIDLALICIDAFEPLSPIESDWEYLYYERHEPGEEEDPAAVQTEAPAGWLNGTDEEAWLTGPAPFAGSAWPNWRTQTTFPVGCFDAYLRRSFTLDSLESINSLLLRVIYDEDPVVYLNGTLIWSATGYKDGDYQLIFLNDKVDALREGENILCVYFRNKTGGGGSVFDMGLYYNAEPVEIQYYDEDGWIIPASASCTNVYSFGDLNKPENILDGSQNTVCGSGFNAENPQTFTIRFRRVEQVNAVYVQCKYEGDYNNGVYGSYDIFAVYAGEETLIGENVPAIIAAQGGYTLTLDAPVAAEAVTVKVRSWEGPGWACVADLFAKSTGETQESPHYDSQGNILNMTASCTGFASYGSINKPENVLDGDQNSVCGSGYDGNVEQSVTVTFERAEMVNGIFVQCKNEGPTDGDEVELIYADGSRGTYSIVAINNGIESLVAENVPAIIGTRGGYTVTLDKAVRAEAIKVVITGWHGTAWACVADIAVRSEGPAPDEQEATFDIDGDGEVTVQDVSALLDILAGAREIPAGVNLNLDGSLPDSEGNTLAVGDVTALLDYIARAGA